MPIHVIDLGYLIARFNHNFICLRKQTSMNIFMLMQLYCLFHLQVQLHYLFEREGSWDIVQVCLTVIIVYSRTPFNYCMLFRL